MYTKTPIENNVIKITTQAHDHINDTIILYKDGARYTDDGYYFDEMELCTNEVEKKLVEISSLIAEWSFCRFDEKTKEFVCDLRNEEQAVTAMIQAITAVATWISFYYRREDK